MRDYFSKILKVCNLILFVYLTIIQNKIDVRSKKAFGVSPLKGDWLCCKCGKKGSFIITKYFLSKYSLVIT